MKMAPGDLLAVIGNADQRCAFQVLAGVRDACSPSSTQNDLIRGESDLPKPEGTS
jgi:hypothetical protein